MNIRSIFLLIIFLLTSCGWFGREEGVLINPDDDYLDAGQAKSLLVPKGMSAVQNVDLMPIPDVPSQVNPRFYPDSPPLPNAIYSNEKRDDVRIQKLGARNWLIVPEPVTTAWPKLKQFFADNGINLDLDDPSLGRLNTEWLTINSEETYRDVVREVVKGDQVDGQRNRFLIKLEQGLRIGTSEIHMRHESEISEGSPPEPSEIFWEIKSDSQEAERGLLNEIGTYIAAKVSEMSVSKVALEIGTMQKSELLRNSNGYPILRLKLDFQRAWATIGQALGNAEADIIELNRGDQEFKANLPLESLGIETRGNILCRITFSCSSDTSEIPVLIQVRATEAGDFDVTVYDQDREELNSEIAQQITVMLRDFAA